jgi:plasmid maintenance system antidote protein VapI
MTGSIEISTVTKLIQICVNKGQTVSSNRETCIRLTDTFSLVLEMLQDIQSNYHLKTEQERTRVNRLLQRLQVATTAANGQFDRCQSRVFSKRIGNFLQSSSIKNKLGELQQELQTIISTLSLVLQIGKSKVSEKWIITRFSIT